MEVISLYDPQYQSASLDEAYLNITDYVMERYADADSIRGQKVLPDDVWSLAADAVSIMRCEIHKKTQLTCSAGVAHNKMLAKVCSDPQNQMGIFCFNSQE